MDTTTAQEARVDPGGRLAAAEHARTVAEQADRHALTLESVLAVLRSPRVDDAAARAEAVEIASAALVDLRTVTDRRRGALLEPVTGAFSRLRADLRPLVRFGDLDVQFVEPPATGRALPGDVAHAARAIVRTAVLALVDDGEPTASASSGTATGATCSCSCATTARARSTRTTTRCARSPSGSPHSTDGSTSRRRPAWGSVLDIALPLDPPPGTVEQADGDDLTPRERDVLRLVATGVGNREIADGLGISVNTVKYHVANLLRKHGDGPAPSSRPSASDVLCGSWLTPFGPADA